MNTTTFKLVRPRRTEPTSEQSRSLNVVRLCYRTRSLRAYDGDYLVTENPMRPGKAICLGAVTRYCCYHALRTTASYEVQLASRKRCITGEGDRVQCPLASRNK